MTEAVSREDYDDAARVKVAIAAAATNDTVGRVMSHLNVLDSFPALVITVIVEEVIVLIF